jgi:hypothetical protein
VWNNVSLRTGPPGARRRKYFINVSDRARGRKPAHLGGTNLKICGEYAGFAQEELERQNPGTQAMFVIGCGGSANPYPRGTVELARQHGQTLAEEVARVAAGPLQPLGGPLRSSVSDGTSVGDAIIGEMLVRGGLLDCLPSMFQMRGRMAQRPQPLCRNPIDPTSPVFGP